MSNSEPEFPQLRVAALILREIVPRRFKWVDLNTEVWPRIRDEFPQSVHDGDRWGKHGLGKAAYLTDQLPGEVKYLKSNRRHLIKYVGPSWDLPDKTWSVTEDYWTEWVLSGARPDLGNYVFRYIPKSDASEVIDHHARAELSNLKDSLRRALG